MANFKCVTRAGDMSSGSRLRIWQQEDGDLIVEIVPEYNKDKPERSVSVEFCTVGSGGGRSSYTRRALFALIEAIKRDNAETPIDYSGDSVI